MGSQAWGSGWRRDMNCILIFCVIVNVDGILLILSVIYFFNILIHSVERKMLSPIEEILKEKLKICTRNQLSKPCVRCNCYMLLTTYYVVCIFVGRFL